MIKFADGIGVWGLCELRTIRVFECREKFRGDGNTQKWGIDFDRVFSTVVKTSTIRLLLILAAAYNLQVTQVDINGKLICRPNSLSACTCVFPKVCPIVMSKAALLFVGSSAQSSLPLCSEGLPKRYDLLVSKFNRLCTISKSTVNRREHQGIDRKCLKDDSMCPTNILQV